MRARSPFLTLSLCLVACASTIPASDDTSAEYDASAVADAHEPGPATCESTVCEPGTVCELFDVECDDADAGDCLRVPTCVPTGDDLDAGTPAVDVPSPTTDVSIDTGARDTGPRDTGPRDTDVRDTGVRDAGPIVGDPCRGPNQPNVLRVMTFNIKSAQVTNLAAIASVINDARVDLVALQEVDRDSDRSGHVDQAARLGALTRMNHVFRATRPLPGGQYGVALLSRFEVLSAVAHDLPAEGFEPRVYVDARLDLGGGRRLRLGFTHLDFHVAAAQPQVREVLRLTSASPPSLILGDFNFTPDRPVHDVMAAQYRDAWNVVGEGRGPTVPAAHPGARIDYVWITRGAGSPRPLCAYVPDTTASDHRPVVAAFPMP